MEEEFVRSVIRGPLGNARCRPSRVGLAVGLRKTEIVDASLLILVYEDIFGFEIAVADWGVKRMQIFHAAGRLGHLFRERPHR